MEAILVFRLKLHDNWTNQIVTDKIYFERTGNLINIHSIIEKAHLYLQYIIE